jgi:putative transposase
MDTAFVMEALMQAMMKNGLPEIFNTDQGSQFTSNEFTSLLEGEMVRISMDRKGRALDNIFIERFWKTLKYEDIYLYRYDTLKNLRKGAEVFRIL